MTSTSPYVPELIREEIANVIDDAADLLEKSGWTQFTEHDVHTGKRCTMGALRKIAVDGDNHRRESFYWATQYIAKNLLDKELHLEPGDYRQAGDVIVGWNDRVCRQQQQVLDKLRECAKELRS